MGIATQQFVRKPLYVEAIQVTTENFVQVSLWCGASIKNNDESPATGPIDPPHQHLKVKVHNPRDKRQTKANVGDWILKTDRGLKVYTNDSFLNSFDPVEGNTNPAQGVLAVEEIGQKAMETAVRSGSEPEVPVQPEVDGEKIEHTPGVLTERPKPTFEEIKARKDGIEVEQVERTEVPAAEAPISKAPSPQEISDEEAAQRYGS